MKIGAVFSEIETVMGILISLVKKKEEKIILYFCTCAARDFSLSVG